MNHSVVANQSTPSKNADGCHGLWWRTVDKHAISHVWLNFRLSADWPIAMISTSLGIADLRVRGRQSASFWLADRSPDVSQRSDKNCSNFRRLSRRLDNCEVEARTLLHTEQNTTVRLVRSRWGRMDRRPTHGGAEIVAVRLGVGCDPGAPDCCLLTDDGQGTSNATARQSTPLGVCM